MESKEKPSKETLDKWHKDPNNWKWGCFYYNKEDQRLLPPKRIEWMGSQLCQFKFSFTVCIYALYRFYNVVISILSIVI